MQFGTKASEAPTFDGEYLRNFKKGETVVRFLQEPDEFVMYYEHYIGNKSFPCTETPSCPGCTHDSDDVKRRSRKYGTYVYNVAQKYTAPYKLAVGLNNKMETRKERNKGTILARDFAVIRTGDGLQTEYDADQEDAYEVDIPKLRALYTGSSIPEILKSSFEAIWGDSDKYAEEEEKPARRRSEPAAAKPKHADEDDDVPDSLKTPEERAAASKDESEVEIDEAELRKMSRAELETLWNKAGFEGFDEDWGKSDLVAEIIKRAS